jgi:hypothetical protein
MQQAALERQPDESDLGRTWCANGGSIVHAGPGAIEAFRIAAEPVHEALAADPLTAELITAVEGRKAAAERSPIAATCGRDVASAFPVSETTGYLGTLPPPGSYRAELTADELLARGSSPGFATANAGLTTWTFTQDGASLEAHNADGVHRCSAPMSSVEGDLVHLGVSSGGCGITFDFLWRPEPDGISMLLLEPPPADRWTVKDFTDFQPLVERVWTRVE